MVPLFWPTTTTRPQVQRHALCPASSQLSFGETAEQGRIDVLPQPGQISLGKGWKLNQKIFWDSASMGLESICLLEDSELENFSSNTDSRI